MKIYTALVVINGLSVRLCESFTDFELAKRALTREVSEHTDQQIDFFNLTAEQDSFEFVSYFKSDYGFNGVIKFICKSLEANPFKDLNYLANSIAESISIAQSATEPTGAPESDSKEFIYFFDNPVDGFQPVTFTSYKPHLPMDLYAVEENPNDAMYSSYLSEEQKIAITIARLRHVAKLKDKDTTYAVENTDDGTKNFNLDQLIHAVRNKTPIGIDCVNIEMSKIDEWINEAVRNSSSSSEEYS